MWWLMRAQLNVCIIRATKLQPRNDFMISSNDCLRARKSCFVSAESSAFNAFARRTSSRDRGDPFHCPALLHA